MYARPAFKQLLNDNTATATDETTGMGRDRLLGC